MRIIIEFDNGSTGDFITLAPVVAGDTVCIEIVCPKSGKEVTALKAAIKKKEGK